MRHRRRSTSSRTGLLAVGVGVALAVGAPLSWSLSAASDDPPDLGSGTAVALAKSITATAGTRALTADAAPLSAAPDAAAPPSTARHSTGRTSATASGSTAPSSRSSPTRSPAAKRHPSAPSPAPATGREPTRLRIDALEVDAPVVPVGVDQRGAVMVPDDVGTVGWYRYGTAAGAAAGSVVLVGHVDSASLGIGAFRALWSASPGMLVRVDRAGGPPLTYRVVSRESFAKDAVPLAALFATGGTPRLTLITCGGRFDSDSLTYTDNIVVTAVPT